MYQVYMLFFTLHMINSVLQLSWHIITNIIQCDCINQNNTMKGKNDMIRIENLSKKYDKVEVLDNLNCTIKDRTIYGLVGSNGAGKSTLLRLINGIFIPDKGKILISPYIKDEQK